MSSLDRLGDANADLVEQAIDLLAEIDDRLFLADPADCSRSGIGAQLRHTADFYRSLLDGLEASRVDYDARKRDPLFEQSRAYAARELAGLAERLRELCAAGADVRLQVRSEAAVFAPGDAAWTRSSLRRELIALYSHTVHHFALVRELLRARGFDPGPGFGLAASTRAHQARACAR